MPRHLIGMGFSDSIGCVAIQEELKQTSIAEDGSMEETWTQDCPLQQLGALLQQQSGGTHIIPSSYCLVANNFAVGSAVEM